MKKALSYILISLIIFVNLFAPFTVGIDKSGVDIKKSIVNAEDEASIQSSVLRTDNSIKVIVDIVWKDNLAWVKDSQIVSVTLSNSDGIPIETKTVPMNFSPSSNKIQQGSVVFSSNAIVANTTYQISTKATQKINDLVNSPPIIIVANPDPFVFKTEAVATPNFVSAGKQNSKSATDTNNETMPACSMNPLSSGEGTFIGCILQAFYYVLFVPTSYLFALAGTFFDNTFSYSVQDSSYRSAFVVQGWGLVRDFCNMFFIFVMLYIAIGTTLSLHGMKTKETIINVVIIGLFINFSLFATQVIIDASNITARVFYNSDAIKITKKGQTDNTVKNAKDGGSIISEETSVGVIPLSSALVNKINPQNLIINSRKVNDIPVKGGGGNAVVSGNSDLKNQSNMSAGTFILIVILASAVNIVGIIVFLSVGLIFVTRVIGLWVAMILAPLAFFTYILPEQMAGIKMIGWKNWWPETFKLAFLAPVFMFFLYIILKSLEIDIISDPINKSGLDFFIATIIPFAFIMILMMKAKSIASDMSGEMGQKITGGVAAAGGMLLGGAALGTAFLGRRVIGAGMAKISRSDDAVSRAGHRIEFNKKLNAWKPSDGTPKPTWDKYKQDNQIKDNKNPLTWLGSKLNEKQQIVNKVDHARHEMDETKKAAGLEGVEDSNMSGEDEAKLKTVFNKNKRSDVETNARKGFNATGKEKLTGELAGGEDNFKSKYRQDEIDKVKSDPKLYDNSTNELTKAGEKKVESELNIKFNDELKKTTTAQLDKMFGHLREESKQNVGMLTRGFARSNKASYDVRNLSQVKADKRDGFFNKVPTAMIAGVALGVRAGLKNSGVNHGQGQGDVLKDIGSTITEALKGIKVEVPKAASGGGHGGGGHDAHAPAGGGHGGGGHH